VLEAYGPSRKLLTFVDSGFPGDIETLIVPVIAPGTYYLMVRSYVGSQSPGKYSVSVSASGTAAPLLFDPFVSHPLGAFAYGMALGDVSGDGRNDVVVGTGYYQGPESFKLFVYEQLSDGTLTDPIKYAIDSGSFQDPASVAIGDLDGDGLNDIAVGAAQGVDIFYQRNGSLADRVLIPANSGEVTIGDIDSDGRNDILVAADIAPGVTTLLKNGASGFISSQVFGQEIWSADIADMNGDGRADIVGRRYDGLVHILFQAPDGSFAESTYNVGGASFLAVGEMTGDGRPDVVTSDGNARIKVLPQVATGGLGPAQTYVLKDGLAEITLADMNGDGRQDVVTNHNYYNQVGILMQRSDGVLRSESLYPRPSTLVIDKLGAGDVTGDGQADLLVAQEGDLDVAPQFQRGAPEWIRNTSPADFAAAVSRTIVPAVTFGRSLDPASITGATVYWEKAIDLAQVTVTLSYNASSKTITLTPSSTRSANTPYVVFVDGVKDTSGNVMPPFSFRFTTGA
jgi:hypothetical protein